MPSPATPLSPFQSEILDRLFRRNAIRSSFRLTGGTALAGFYLFHRCSDDLDLVTPSLGDSLGEEATAIVRECATELGATYQPMGTVGRQMFLHREADSVKIDLLVHPWRRGNLPQPPLIKDPVVVDSLLDIAAGKCSAFADRSVPRDYVDLYFILKETAIGFPDLLRSLDRSGMAVDRVNLSMKIQSELREIEADVPWEMLLKPMLPADFRSLFQRLAESLLSNA